jgi:iron complex outermembrane receptor protein
MNPFRLFPMRRFALLLPVIFAGSLFTSGLQAQSATGTLEGRVFNSAGGVFLERARLTVAGTAVESFTDADGYYRLTNIPSGPTQVTVFYTGLPPQTQQVTVPAGQTLTYNFELGGSAAADPGTSVVKLDEFKVRASREMNAAALAINEQRFASNIKNVVSADEFGDVADGNVAEFMKFLPGVTIDYVGGDAREVSINGVPSANVPVTVDGFDFASAAPNNTTGRAAQIGFFSTSSISRIEVDYSPTPESQGAALAGSVNMVPRSAFERSKPSFSVSVSMLMRDSARDFHKTPGPTPEPTRKVHPAFEFTGIVPVNKRFGFTVSASQSKQYSGETISENSWRGSLLGTNGTTFPNTTPDKPYLTTYVVGDRPKHIERGAFGATFDFRLTPRDRLSLSLQYSSFGIMFMNRNMTFNVNRVLPGNFSPTFTRGFTGAGDITLVNGGSYRANRTYTPTLVWRHDGPIWRAEAGLGGSHATYSFRDQEKGMFAGATVRRTGVTVSFDDIFYLRPNTITVTDGATGAPLDPYRLDNYALISARSDPSTTYDIRRTAYTSLRRDFHGRVPFTLKAGLDFRGTVRDLRGVNDIYNYVGRDGVGSTTPVGTDDTAAPVLDASFSQRVAPFGFPRIQWPGTRQALELQRAAPASFVRNANDDYRAEVSRSKRAEETVSSAYVRGDLALLERRLKLVGGLRAEQTNIEAEGPLTDPTLNFQRDSQGRVIRGANGVPLPISTVPLEVSRRTFIDRGARTEKEYLRLFPSLNASFSLREDLIARAAYYRSIGRPDYNQYAGGVTLPDLENPASPNNVIRVNNVSLKPWTAESVTLRLEYYFQGVGQISFGAFRRDFENFFGGSTLRATPDFLTLYDLDPALYAPYDVVTQQNIAGTVRIEGTTFNYKQALTFLPAWARGLQVFANASAQRATGNTLNAFTGAFVVPRSASWGLSLTREHYTLRANWNYRGRHRREAVAAATGIEPGTYNWFSKRLGVDVIGEVRLRKNLWAFANLRNIGDEPDDVEVAGPSTPDYAQFRRRQYFGSLWSFGLRSTF